jgi:hypothetical protein
MKTLLRRGVDLNCTNHRGGGLSEHTHQKISTPMLLKSGIQAPVQLKMFAGPVGAPADRRLRKTAAAPEMLLT